MDATDTPASAPNPPDPSRDRGSETLPDGIAYLLCVVRILLIYGRRLTQIATDRGAEPPFATVAALCGTHDISIILARIQRGILRLLALEAYLTKRSLKGRDIVVRVTLPRLPSPPPLPPEPAPDVPAEARKRRTAYDPNSAHIPTIEELDAEVRRTAIGRTIARVCMDLAVAPAFCTGEVWNAILETIQFCGGSFQTVCAVRTEREKTFQHERDKRPETWGWDWRDTTKPKIRAALGWLIGEAPILDPPDPQAALA